MEVTFTKLTGRRYWMSEVRDRGPALARRQAPGYDEYLPHEAVHLLVEAGVAPIRMRRTRFPGIIPGFFGPCGWMRQSWFPTDRN